LAAEFLALRNTQQSIDWSGADAESVARAAAAQQTGADRRMVEARLRAAMGAAPRSSWLARHWRWPLVLAAAALLVLLVLTRNEAASRPGNGGYLGGGVPAAEAPRVVVESGQLVLQNVLGLSSRRFEFVLLVDGVERAREQYSRAPQHLPDEWLPLIDRGQTVVVKLLLDDRVLVVPVVR
jgi:hypothetical protein